MKYLILITLLLIGLYGAEERLLTGQWKSITKSMNHGTRTIEKEYLSFNADHTFEIVFLVSVQKRESYVKDLRIEGKGIWKSRANVLVVVVNRVEVPVAKEVYGVSEASLKQIADTFHQKFLNDPIRIVFIKTLTHQHLVTENDQLQHIDYERQLP